MAANSIMNSAFQKIGVFGKTQRGSRMLRILLADDEPVFLSKMEHLLMRLLFWISILEIVAAPVSIWLDGFGRREMMQLSSLSQAMLNTRPKGMSCVRSGIF